MDWECNYKEQYPIRLTAWCWSIQESPRGLCALEGFRHTWGWWIGGYWTQRRKSQWRSALANIFCSSAIFSCGDPCTRRYIQCCRCSRWSTTLRGRPSRAIRCWKDTRVSWLPIMSLYVCPELSTRSYLTKKLSLMLDLWKIWSESVAQR